MATFSTPTQAAYHDAEEWERVMRLPRPFLVHYDMTHHERFEPGNGFSVPAPDDDPRRYFVPMGLSTRTARMAFFDMIAQWTIRGTCPLFMALADFKTPDVQDVFICFPVAVFPEDARDKAMTFAKRYNRDVVWSFKAGKEIPVE